MARVNEAVTKAVVCALKSTPSDDNDDEWLNPTEVAKKKKKTIAKSNRWKHTNCI